MKKQNSSTEMSPMKQALKAIQQLKARVIELESTVIEPIAVVSMGCRFPGDNTNPSRLWDNLRRGQDAITEIPKDRWDVDSFYDPDPDVPGKMYTKFGGFLDKVDHFDPAFFGISAREAASMDPHQRLLLQTIWESLEYGGIDPSSLYGSKTGVYVGVSNFEYGSHLLFPNNPSNISTYSGTGGSMGVTAGRVSYTYGFTGPSIMVDTACSSSLVTTHLAMNALRNGECDIALSAGVNLFFGPNTFVNFSKAKMLAPDGHCKTFSAEADGYARGEGVGVLVLKRLSDAKKDGDNIIALLRGSSVNQDGPSGGLTVPNGPSQVSVIQEALKNAGIEPTQVGYVEAHGTGTKLGDPIEISALDKVFSKNRDKQTSPLRVSSIKTNIGHLESAAGIAGLIKTILVVQKGEIPPHQNFTEPNPHIDWDSIPIEIPIEATSWTEKERFAGVSSFSFSGTNSHIVVSNYIQDGDDQKSKNIGLDPDSPKILAISSKNEANLEALAKKVGGELAVLPKLEWESYCRSFAHGRGHFSRRIALVGTSPKEVSEQLLKGEYTLQKIPSIPPKVAFMFTGQGPQFLNMGKQLFEQVPFFRQTMEECDEILRPILGESMLDMLYPTASKEDEFEEKIHKTNYTQPLLFSYEYSLARLWQHWGVEPDALIGHSMGEIVAATISGLFTLEQALSLVFHRGKLMTERCKTGAMVSISLSEKTISDILEQQELSEQISIAAVNTHENTVVAGDSKSINLLKEHLDKLDCECKDLAISHAFHSPMSVDMIPEFEDVVHQFSLGELQIPLISNITGGYASEELIGNAGYWGTHVRETVHFREGLTTLLNDGFNVFIEIGPKPILTAFGRDIEANWAEKHSSKIDDIEWLPSNRKHIESFTQILKHLSRLYTLGNNDVLNSFFREGNKYPIQVSTTPFVEKPYWFEFDKADAEMFQSEDHPLLGSQISSPVLDSSLQVFKKIIRVEQSTFLSHHEVFGEVVLPAAAHVETMIAAAYEQLLKLDRTLQTKNESYSTISLKDISINKALVLSPVDGTELQTVISPELNNNLSIKEENSAFQIDLYSSTGNSSTPWKEHSHARFEINYESNGQENTHFDLDKLLIEHEEELSVDDYYKKSHALGIAHGEQFQAMESICRGPNGYLGKLVLPKGVGGLHDQRFFLHPVLLDAAFQMASYHLIKFDEPYLPVGIKSVQFNKPLTQDTWCYLVPNSPMEDDEQAFYEVTIWLMDSTGEVLAQIESLRFQRVQVTNFGQESTDIESWLYRLQWEQKALPGYTTQSLLESEALSKQLKQTTKYIAESCSFYEDLFTQFDQVSAQKIQHALINSGWNPIVGQEFEWHTLHDKCGVKEEFKPFFNRLISILVEDGVFEQNEHTIKVVQEFHIELDNWASELRTKYDKAIPEIDLFEQCLKSLDKVWQGLIDPLTILFPKDKGKGAHNLYRESIGSKQINRLLAETMQHLTSEVSRVKKIRIIEIGAGTGGTTIQVLPLLDKHQCSYLFTDISAHFTQQAAQKWGQEYEFVEFNTLDIEQPIPKDLLGQFDIVIAANVLHATQDLNRTLSNCNDLLADGGALLLLEATAKQRWLDLTFGMTDGWWRFMGNDNYRNQYPLLNINEWENAFDRAGFESTLVLGEEQHSIKEGLKQHVYLARKQFLDISSTKATTKTDKIDTGNSDSAWLVVHNGNGNNVDLHTILDEPYTLFDVTSEHNLWKDIDWSTIPNLLFIHAIDRQKNKKTGSMTPVMEEQEQLIMPVFQILQQAMAHEYTALKQMVILTEESLVLDKLSSGITQSSLQGLVHAIQSEYPTISTKLIDLEAGLSEGEISEYLTLELHQKNEEPEVIYRLGKRSVSRLKRYESSRELNRHEPMMGGYLITGGFGVIGMQTAEYLVENGVTTLWLLGRGLPNQEVRDRLDILEQRGTQVHCVQADISDRSALVELFNTIPKNELKGVIHAAGTLENAVLMDLDWQKMETVFQAKIQGAWNLHELTQDYDLDHFILYSSIGSIFGPIAQANYAAANSFMDQLALNRQQMGLAGLAINWGAWSEAGLAQKHAEKSQVLAMQGIELITPEQGRRLIKQIFDEQGQIVVLPINWGESVSQMGRELLIKDLKHGNNYSVTMIKDYTQWKEELLTKPEGEQLDDMIVFVTQIVAKVLGGKEADLDVSTGFFDLGMDSLTSVELRNMLQSTFDIQLPSTLIFKYPTIEDVSEYLLDIVTNTHEIDDVDEAVDLANNADLQDSASTNSATTGSNIEEMSEEELQALIDNEFFSLGEDDD
jgi:acyl transferase domain-containing protein/acyl carrier protein/short-subunit dehydrogenase